MAIFVADAVRESDWWVCTVVAVGVTQGRTRSEAREMAADLVATMVGLHSDEFSVKVDFDDSPEE